jgi:adenine-specific DNA-methyltransferase
MPTLNWIGKDKVINHHLDVPFRILESQYTFTSTPASGAETPMEDQPNNPAENLIINGDNLEALKALLPRYEGQVKCIYIDPPYNTGNEGWVYNDNVNDPKIKRWLAQTVGKEGEDLSRHDKWLCMMYPRLKLLHKLLAEDGGSIWVSIDDNEYSNLKLICDEIFGSSNFISNIIWQKNYSPKNSAKHFSVDHDSILVYAKNA